jgi:hypothetical protein
MRIHACDKGGGGLLWRTSTNHLAVVSIHCTHVGGRRGAEFPLGGGVARVAHPAHAKLGLSGAGCTPTLVTHSRQRHEGAYATEPPAQGAMAAVPSTQETLHTARRLPLRSFALALSRASYGACATVLRVMRGVAPRSATHVAEAGAALETFQEQAWCYLGLSR